MPYQDDITEISGMH